MHRRLRAGSLVVVSALLVLAACSAPGRGAWRVGWLAATEALPAPASPRPSAAATPLFSPLQTSTPLPTMAGPLGTLTAIAVLVASPTQNAEPYAIANRGQPHFIEFHAWW